MVAGTLLDDEVETVWVGPRILGDLALAVDGAVEGDASALILGVSSIEEAEDGDLVFAENGRYLALAGKSRATAVVARLDAAAPGKPVIRVENPRFAFARIMALFQPPSRDTKGVHPTAEVSRSCRVPESASVGPSAVIGEDVTLGEDVVIGAGTYVGEGCVIGDGCRLHPNVTLYGGTRLGRRVIVHSGAVLGADGFGYVRVGDASYRIPQLGVVEVGDDVEIGANTTIDRAKTGTTVIGARTKIDNLVHVAHNCKIGSDCIIIAQVGIAGSTHFGRGVVAAGQVGIADHVAVGDGAVLLAQSGVIGDVAPGMTVSGYPAREHRSAMRQSAEVARLPETAKRLRALEKANAELAARNERLECLVARLAERLGESVEA